MEKPVETIHVALIGGAGSGKTELKNCIRELGFFRQPDHRTFKLLVEEYEPSGRNDIQEAFQFALLVFDTSSQISLGDVNKLRRLAAQIAEQGLDRKLLCFVGTKIDLIPEDFSELDLRTRRFASFFPFYWDHQYFAVSSFTGVGIKNLCFHIANEVHPPQGLSQKPTLTSMYQNSLSWVLDKIASFFALRVPTNCEQTTVMPDLDDDAVDCLVQTPEALAWDKALAVYTTSVLSSPTWVPTHKITPQLIVKRLSHNERANLVYVRKNTTIPVPQTRYPNMSKWLVMDLVKGKSLRECWGAQSFFMKFRIACTLRGYIGQLRRLSGTIPGSPTTGLSTGILFDDQDCGPFKSATEFRIYCNHIAYTGWESVARSRRSHNPRSIPPQPQLAVDEWPLVFTHADLNMSNIMLSDDGVLWIVDWETAGFFPPWLETIGIGTFDDAPSSWRRLRWFIAGADRRYEAYWAFFVQDVHRFQLMT